jgi:two-component system, NtrC family, sensor histidine kinase HydH
MCSLKHFHLGAEERTELCVAILLRNRHTSEISPLHSKSENALSQITAYPGVKCKEMSAFGRAMQTSPSWFQKIEVDSLKKQQIAFSVLTLLVLAMLLVLHTLFSSVLGEPSLILLATLTIGFLFKIGELLWFQGRQEGTNVRSIKLETACSITLTFGLSGFLAYLTNRDDSPYFVLLAIPILQAAYQLSLFFTLLTVFLADLMMFFWMWHFFLRHPPVQTSEYVEVGMISILYLLMGSLVWFLVRQLRLHQTRLFANMEELESTRERLLQEEKLAAIGRLSSGIAHEIRNPVAMISSSLATAISPGIRDDEREEMFSIAAKEAERLGKLTAEFLNYARPSAPQLSTVFIHDLLVATADSAKAHATKKSVFVRVHLPENIAVDVDSTQIQSILLNLVLNAIDATPGTGTVNLTAAVIDGSLAIHVEDSGAPIPEQNLVRIFEPFFTTKPNGTGLGLAIARSIARTHGGDLYVTRNENSSVVFTLILPLSVSAKREIEVAHG